MGLPKYCIRAATSRLGILELISQLQEEGQDVLRGEFFMSLITHEFIDHEFPVR